ncbi:MAG: hypothetical protein CVV27_13890 [Candidatus Melainabacteria bacterium HGW-Melainabacteria-1]|nr:MAG: hypothetical protein CVV27_13890 [Candidatus Melainabacteria bacterium HGW-Melainabacteria-1]
MQNTFQNVPLAQPSQTLTSRSAEKSWTSEDLSFEQANTSLSPKLAAITARLKQSLTHTSRDILTSGQLLIQAKSLLGHGHFRKWLTDNFSMSAKSANRFMSVALMVQRHQLDEDAKAKLLCLDFRSLYELAAKSTPESVQSRALAELNSGKICYELIRDWKQIERQGAPAAGPANVSQLSDQLQHFEAWLHHHAPLLEKASGQLDAESRQALQRQTRQLREAVSRAEAILAQIQTYHSEPDPESQSAETYPAYWNSLSCVLFEPGQPDRP